MQPKLSKKRRHKLTHELQFVLERTPMQACRPKLSKYTLNQN
jgi:hypothetical protein